MEAEQISVSYKRTTPLEAYGSVSIGASVIVKISPENDRRRIYESLYEELRDFVLTKIKEEKHVK